MCVDCEPFPTLFPWFGLLVTIPSLPWLVPFESLFKDLFELPRCAVLTVDWLYLL